VIALVAAAALARDPAPFVPMAGRVELTPEVGVTTGDDFLQGRPDFGAVVTRHPNEILAFAARLWWRPDLGADDWSSESAR
jgi:hypothetical protein